MGVYRRGFVLLFCAFFVPSIRLRQKSRFFTKVCVFSCARAFYNVAMVVYIEYALAENFLVDCFLLYLACFTARRKIPLRRLVFAALIGAVGAVVFPLLPIAAFWAYPLKFLGGAGLCFLASGKEKFWRVCPCFFTYSFALAGALFAFASFQAQAGGYFLSQTGATIVVCGGGLFTAVCVAVVKKCRIRKAVLRHTYDCTAIVCGREAKTTGFLDSGNMAFYKGVAVCFISPDLAYDLREADIWTDEKLQIVTLSGVKTLSAFKGFVEIKTDGKIARKEVYFAVSGNMLSRGYKLLLHSQILDD